MSEPVTAPTPRDRVADEPPAPGEIQRVGVLGAGTMGAGIAQLCARAGIETLLCDANPDALAAGLARIESSLARAVERGRSTEAEAAATRERVRPAASVEELAGVELAIEVVPEIVDLKAQLLSALAALPGEPILASNTSSISIATLAERSGAPERVLGLHFFNPPTAMPLIELVATPRDRPRRPRPRADARRAPRQAGRRRHSTGPASSSTAAPAPSTWSRCGWSRTASPSPGRSTAPASSSAASRSARSS